VPKSAGIYARISSDREGLQLGVQRQVEDCRALAERRNWPVVKVYVDDDVSAYKSRIRPAYQQMLADLRNGVLDAVIAWNLDRLHRQPKELEQFFDICDAAQVVDLASVAGDINLGSDDGRFHARILGAVARKESDDKSRRLKRKHLELAQNGKVAGGGTRPFGYESDRRTIVPEEAAVIRNLARRVLAGDSLLSLCRDLTDRGVPTVKGGRWTVQVLRNVLMSGRISGQREHNGEIVATAEWEGIITPDETDRLRRILADPERPANRTPRRYLLNRLVRCGRCGATLISRPRGDGKRRYVCNKAPGLPGCGGTAIVADELERFIVDAMLYSLDTPELAASLAAAPAAPEGDAAEARRALDEAHAQLEELAAAYGERQITMREFIATRAPIEKRMKQAQARAGTENRSAVLADFVVNPKALREDWGTLTLTRQRAIVAAVMDHATIAPATRGRNSFDPARVTPHWRI
jgi:site-specific DNA recombinase